MEDFETNKKYLRFYRPHFRQIRRLETEFNVIDDRTESTYLLGMIGQPGGGKRLKLVDELTQYEKN